MHYELRKPLERIYKLLNLLIDSEQPLSKQEVTVAIACSRPTLDKTIIDANHLIESFSQIIFTSEGLELSKKQCFNKRQAKALVSKETFLFQFLYDLLRGKIYSIEEWAKGHYISSSVAYRQLRRVSDYLLSIGVTLKNEDNQWFLEGDSWTIHYLYFQLLKELSIVGEVWHFKELDMKVIQAFTEAVCEELELTYNPIASHLYGTMVGIHLSMASNPYTIETVNDEKYRNLLETHAFDRPLAMLEKHIQQKITSNEKAMIISSIELFPVRYLTLGAMHRRIVHASLTDHEVYQLAIATYRIFLPNDDNMEALVCYLDIFTPLQIIEEYFEFRYEPFEKDFIATLSQTKEAAFIAKIELLKKDLVGKSYRDCYYKNKNSLDRQLYILFKSFQANKKQAPLKLTFLSRLGMAQESYYQQEFLTYFSSKRIEVQDAFEVQKNNSWHELDLIVTDDSGYPLKNSGKTFYVEGQLTDLDFRKMEIKLSRLEEEGTNKSRGQANPFFYNME